jgi:hypothetical protein
MLHVHAFFVQNKTIHINQVALISSHFKLIFALLKMFVRFKTSIAQLYTARQSSCNASAFMLDLSGYIKIYLS